MAYGVGAEGVQQADRRSGIVVRWRSMLAVTVLMFLGLTIWIASRPASPAATVTAPLTGFDPVGTAAPTSSTSAPTTSTTAPDRVSQVEDIMRDLYFGWFDGLYRKDMDTIDAVAGTEAVLGWAERAFDTVRFRQPPTRDAIGIEVKRILLDRPDCLVVSADVDYRAIVDTDTISTTVDVYFRVGDGWGFATKYKYERELWLVDCDFMERR